MPHGLLRDEVFTMHGRVAGGVPPLRVPRGWFARYVSGRDRLVFGVDALARILKP